MVEVGSTWAGRTPVIRAGSGDPSTQKRAGLLEACPMPKKTEAFPRQPPQIPTNTPPSEMY